MNTDNVEEVFSDVEHAFAERLLLDAQDKKAAFFLKTLLFAARQGHLCLKINHSTIEPDLKMLFGLAEDEEALKEMLRKSAEALPVHFLHTPSCMTDPALKPVIRCGDSYYLHRYFAAENRVLTHWRRIADSAPSAKVDPNLAQIKLDALKDQLLPEQLDAVRLACEKSFLILTGGPGTGKTFTAGQTIGAFLQALPGGQKNPFQIALAAPTGKAASNLEKSLKNALPQGFEGLKGKTLHSLLGIKTASSKGEVLPHDLIVVDESSMIDAEMMGSLLASVKDGARLILIGDKDQLPPVEAGGIFADLCSIHPCTVLLKKCMRSELEEIVDFAQRINSGESGAAWDLLKASKGVLGHMDPEENDFKELIRKACAFFTLDSYDPEEALAHYNRFRLLSPLRQGPFGADAINRTILDELRKKHQGPVFMAPIMIKTNDPKRELFNGEIGLLIKHGDPFKPLCLEDRAYFPGGKVVRALLLPRFEYAYCLSVYKSQGSEFDHVFLILPEGSETFGRKVVYTAVTRTKKMMTLFGKEEIFKKTIARTTDRLSGISLRGKFLIS